MQQTSVRKAVSPGSGGEAVLRSARGAVDSARGRIPVLLVVSSLEHGGAERQVVELANNLDEHEFDVTVCSLAHYAPLAKHLRKPDQLVIIPRRRKYDPSVIWRLARLMQARGTQVAHAFLFDAEIATRLAARLTGVPAVIASERNADYRIQLSHRIARKATDRLFDRLVANSEAGRRFSVRELGIAADRIDVVRNGVDVQRFRPLPKAAVRDSLGYDADAPIIGMIAVFKRQKRHGDFFAIAQRVLQRFPRARFICVGEPMRSNQQGAEDYHREVRALVERLGLLPHFDFLGSRDDMPEIYNLCDVTVLPSEREGTPNVLLESMACGTPVIASDIADNRAIVPDGRAGYIAPLGDIDAFADRVCRLLAAPERQVELSRAARAWAVAEFSTRRLAERTADVYRRVLAEKTAREIAPLAVQPARTPGGGHA